MDLKEAKKIFKFEKSFTQRDIDDFYNFEKGILLDKLASDGSDEELKATQDALAKLERAYSVLGIKLGDSLAQKEIEAEEKAAQKAADPDFDDFSDKNSKSQNKNVAILAALLVVIGGGFAYIHFSTPPVPQQVATPPKKSPPKTSPTTETSTSSRPEKSFDFVGQNKEETVVLLKKRLDELETLWAPYKSEGYTLSGSILTHIKKGDDLAESQRLTQAIYHYDEAEFFFTKHIDALDQYWKSRDKVLVLEEEWAALANKEQYIYHDAIKHSEKIESFERLYREGLRATSVDGAMDAIAFKYKKTIALGEKVKSQHAEYLTLKQQWEKTVANVNHYTLTPSIQLLIDKTTRPVSTDEFEYLSMQVYPRLINHFEEHLSK